MTMDGYLAASLSPGYFQPRVGLGSSFARPRLYSVGPVAHFQLGDQPEQCGVVQRRIVREPLRSPLHPHLHGVFEAEFARVYAGTERCLRHEQTNQVVGEQMNPPLNSLGDIRCSGKKMAMCRR